MAKHNFKVDKGSRTIIFYEHYFELIDVKRIVKKIQKVNDLKLTLHSTSYCGEKYVYNNNVEIKTIRICGDIRGYRADKAYVSSNCDKELIVNVIRPMIKQNELYIYDGKTIKKDSGNTIERIEKVAVIYYENFNNVTDTLVNFHHAREIFLDLIKSYSKYINLGTKVSYNIYENENNNKEIAGTVERINDKKEKIIYNISVICFTDNIDSKYDALYFPTTENTYILKQMGKLVKDSNKSLIFSYNSKLCGLDMVRCVNNQINDLNKK